MWRYFGQKSFPMDEREYLEHLEAIGRYITSVDKVQVRGDSSLTLLCEISKPSWLATCLNIRYLTLHLQLLTFLIFLALIHQLTFVLTLIRTLPCTHSISRHSVHTLVITAHTISSPPFSIFLLSFSPNLLDTFLSLHFCRPILPHPLPQPDSTLFY